MKLLIRCSLVLMLLVGATGCGPKKVTGATPAATAALNADAAVIRVNELQATVLDVCGPQPVCSPSIDTNLAREIVAACIAARHTLKTVPDGWQATVKTAWAESRKRFANVTNPSIVAALGLVDALLGGL